MEFATIILLVGLFHSGTTSWMDSLLNVLDIESCNNNYISPNFPLLNSEFKSRLFGQGLIINKLIPTLSNHFEKSPRKALVICMHGWTGSGKNYAVQIVIENMYRKKFDSKFVRFFNGRLHFPSDKMENVEHYKINLQNWIRGNVSECPRSIFIFDEVDKMPPGILDSIKPFLDYHGKIDSVDYSKSIFIFISNIGGGVINRKFMELWRQGILRHEMKYSDFEPHLRRALYSTTGGFKSSSILEGHLVTLYLPFLPMQEEEVRQCIISEMKRQSIRTIAEEKIQSLIDSMEFNSDGISTSGCKRVADLVSSLHYTHLDEL
ncbi:hypothetical protein RUM44_012865 [Polyplax serrata]|uniref:Torsin n=1 Tax=Polyplax serrata TaxID=468196 RepID=A0ABR1BCJ6_POLSC